MHMHIIYMYVTKRTAILYTDSKTIDWACVNHFGYSFLCFCIIFWNYVVDWEVFNRSAHTAWHVFFFFLELGMVELQ
jgi:hypothetical protein